MSNEDGEYDYIFGFGSISEFESLSFVVFSITLTYSYAKYPCNKHDLLICNLVPQFISIVNTSTHATWQTSENKEAISGAVATIKKSFGYRRKWNFRSTTGRNMIFMILCRQVQH